MPYTVPLKSFFSSKSATKSCARLFIASALTLVTAKTISYADTADALAVPRPFEVGASLSGNYLAAIVAGAERDTLAASTFFREALRLSLIHI